MMQSTLKYLMILFVAGMMAACGSEDEEITDRMAKEHEGDSPVENGSALYKQEEPVDTMSVAYADTDSGAVTGFLAKPKEEDDDRPGLIVIHEWWGLNDNVRMMTQRLAGLGYRALAVDLYNGNTAESPNMAQQYMKKAQSNPQGAKENLQQAYNYLTNEQGAEEVGVIGWCFGGGWSLQTALAMPDKIDAAVIYYGQLVTDRQQLQKLSMPILAFFGGQDESIPLETINNFEDTLNDLDKDVQVYIYDDAGHAFANPSGTRYNKEAAADSWKKTKEFLDENLDD